MRGMSRGRTLASMTRAPVFLAAALASAALLAGCDIGESDRVGGEEATDPHVLTLLNPFTNPEDLTPFATEVARLSGGELRIRVIPGRHERQPDYEAAVIRDVMHGRADLGMAASRAWDEFGVDSLRALNAPLLIDSYPLQERVLESDVVTPMLEELREIGLAGIGILPGPMRRPHGFRGRLAAPHDFRGLTIGIQQSRLAAAVMRELGARPLRLAADRPNTDALDGVESRVGAIEADRLDVEGSHLMTNIELWPRPLVLVAGAETYRQLTPAERRILRVAAANVVPKTTTLVRDSELESSGNICRRGVASFDSATPEELRALRRGLEPVYRNLERDPATRAAIEAIERMKTRLGTPPAELPSCEATAKPPVSSASAIDGVWRMDTDDRTAGPDPFAENWGHWIFVLDRGRFADTQENPEACTWGYGKFVVKGSRTSWAFMDGGGIAPNNAMNREGEFFVFGFSRYRDTLTLTPVKGEISPLNFRAKPWRRLSDNPSRRFFSKRCPPPAGALPG